MKRVSCKDVGGEDDFVAEGETDEEVKKKLGEHAMANHAESYEKMSEEEKKEKWDKVDQLLKEQSSD